MKAYDLTLFLLLVNACFVLFGSLGIEAFDAEDSGAEMYGSGDVDYENITTPGERSAGDSGTIFSGESLFLWGTLIAGVFIGGLGGLSIKVTTPQVVGILAFAIIFWGAFISAEAILFSLQLPYMLIFLLNVMHWWVFVAAIIQMSTGTSFDNMA